MSQWTHVAGIIRIDSMLHIFGDDTDTTRQILEARLGRTWNFDDLPDVPDTHIPAGTEGSIQYSIVHTGAPNDLAWGHVAIWGDLRDFYDGDVIRVFNWLTSAIHGIQDLGIVIRDLIVSVDVESGPSYIIFIDADDYVRISQAKALEYEE